MAFEIDIGFHSSAGRNPVNEDFAAAMLPEPGREAMGAIAAIADGVSTGGFGREAAQTTVTSLVRDYFCTPETWDTTVALDRVIGAQNAWLAGVNHRREPSLGMTTLTALVLRGQSWTLAHVGDTRALLLRDGELRQLSHDHAPAHPELKHQLLRAIGQEDHVVIDYSQGDMQPGDAFILLSDGVHGVLAQRKIAALLAPRPRAPDADHDAGPVRADRDKAEAHRLGRTAMAGAGESRRADQSDAQTTAQTLSETLVAAALKHGSHDNATALIVRVLSVLESTLHDELREARQLPPPTRLAIGQSFDGLNVTAIVADNGINMLYQVRDPKTRKLYALKALNQNRAHDAGERTMLAHEAWLAKRVQGSRAAEHLVRMHDRLPHQPPRSSHYLLYDWHSGETLQQMLDRNVAFSVPQAVAIATQAARALGALHRQGVIHRDVKPANLHQGEDGVLRVLDLGVALSGREPESTRLLHAGTPSYINPEQWGFDGAAAQDAPPEPPDAQSDLYALGVTLYQLVSGGKLPYGEVAPYQVGRYWRDPVRPSRHNPQTPIWLDRIALKAVARDKRQRFETAEELLLALERGALRPLAAPNATPLIQRDPTVPWKIGFALAVLVNLLLIYWLLFLPTR